MIYDENTFKIVICATENFNCENFVVLLKHANTSQTVCQLIPLTTPTIPCVNQLAINISISIFLPIMLHFY